MTEGHCDVCGAVEWFVGTNLCRVHLAPMDPAPDHADELHGHAVAQDEDE